MASSSVPSSSRPQYTYDVFLSFRGDDTRDNIVSHFYTLLVQKGINTFKDDEKLEGGEVISPELRRAIRESRFSIFFLSKNYASSRWCLDELVEALECSNTTVIPIFYHVDPSEVRRQTGSFGQGFDELVSKQGLSGIENVQRWRNALEQVGNLSGWPYPSDTFRSESMFIQEVVGKVFRKLNRTYEYASVVKDLVGMDSRMQKVVELLGLGMGDARFVGILGMGGIGKTTISRAVYDRISCQFEGYSFIENVREVSKKSGLKTLQEQLISEILMEKDLKVGSDDQAEWMIRNMVCCKKVLIVLDDVDESTKLKNLVGEHDWYSFGSRIIITTRNKHVLTSFGITHIYEVEELREDEAIKLFELKAFGKHPQMGGYGELVCRAVEYAKGVPLALKVLGSLLCGRNKDEWKSSLKRLKQRPMKEVQHVIRISYDALDWQEQQIFLDIACFFKGKDEKDVTKILESCGIAIIGINILVERSLITISYNKLLMHDLIQEVGHHIVWEQSCKEPGKRTRLWLDEDIKRVLMDNTGTNKVEGLVMQYSDLRCLDPKDSQFLKQLKLGPKAFAKMSNLRILKICCMHLSKELKYLSNELRYLEWLGYPMKYMPSTFQPEHLVELHLTYSNIEQLWEGTMHLDKLRIMDLSHSTYLTKSPNFKGVPNLERLILEGCTGLVNLHLSIGDLKRLTCLNLKDCKSLKSLPCGIQLESLEVFIASGCSKLDNVLVSLGYMNCLSKLCLDGTGISELPPSVGHLTNLGLISLSNCKNLRSIPDIICQLKDLRNLNLSGCSKLDKLPQDLGVLDCLYELHIDWTAIRQLPSSIGLLKKLGILTLKGCKGISSNSWSFFFLPSVLRRERDNSMASELEALSGLKSLCKLDLSYCNLKSIPIAICHIDSLVFLDLSGNNMERLPASMNQLSRLSGLVLNGCKKLQELPEISSEIHGLSVDDCPSLRTTWIPNKCNTFGGLSFNILTEKFLSNKFQRNFRAMNCYFDVVLPGREIPKWFSYQTDGSSISCQLPPHWFNNRFLGFAYAAVGFKEDKSDYCYIKMSFKCHVTQRIIEWGEPIPTVKFGNMVVRCVPRGAFSGITENDMERLNEEGLELNIYFYKLIRYSSIRENEKLGVEVYEPVYEVEIEKVGVHVFYKEAEEQALSSSISATTSKRRRDHDLNDNHYNAAAAALSGSPGIDDQEDHLNSERLSCKRLCPETMSSSSSMGGGEVQTLRFISKKCRCGKKAAIRVVESENPSKGRLYYVCEKASFGGCDFWAWCNPVEFAFTCRRDETNEKPRVEEGEPICTLMEDS